MTISGTRTTTSRGPGGPRAAGVGLALAALLALGACGGDGDEGDGAAERSTSPGSSSSESTDGAEGTEGTDGATEGEPGGAGTSGAPEELPGDASTGETLPPLAGADCDATVTLSGGVEATWSGVGDAITADETGAPAVYESQDGAYRLTVTAAGLDFDAAAILTEAGGLTYGATGDPGIDVAADGTGGSVSAALTAPELPGETVQVTATFTC